MPNFREAFPSKYLKADDFKGPRPMQIESVDIEDVGAGQQKEEKLVVSFVEVLKGLVLNRINAETIAEIASTEDYGQWAGVTVELYPTKTEFQGKRVPFIRVQPPSGGTQDHRATASRRARNGGQARVTPA